MPSRHATRPWRSSSCCSKRRRRRDLPIYVVLTMRSDFIGDCMDYPGLPEALNHGQYLVPRMTRDELRSAITGPVAVAGGDIAPRLVRRLLNDIGDNQDELPLLQHALMRTWEHWHGHNAAGQPDRSRQLRSGRHAQEGAVAARRGGLRGDAGRAAPVDHAARVQGAHRHVLGSARRAPADVDRRDGVGVRGRRSRSHSDRRDLPAAGAVVPDAAVAGAAHAADDRRFVARKPDAVLDRG